MAQPAAPAALANGAATDTQPAPDYSAPEYRALLEARDAGSVSFHQVATAWFNWHFGGERCKRCHGTGTLLSAQPKNGKPPSRRPAETVSERRCSRCDGVGTVPNPASARAYEEIFPDLMRVFGEQRGGVISAYFCENIRVAAALTDIWSAAERSDGPILTLQQLRDEQRAEAERVQSQTRVERMLDRVRGKLPHLSGRFQQTASSTAIHLEPIFGDPDSPRAKAILFRCLKLHYHALEYLKPKPRKICMRMTFNVITTLLGTLDSRAARGEPASAFESSYDDQRTLHDELASTETYYLTSAQRTARLEYIFGMLIGVPLAAAAAIVIYQLDWAPRELSISFTAGAVGGLVSVMERLTNGKLNLNHEAGKATLRILGTIRPMVGAFFGLALFFFVSGGVVDITIPSGEAERYFFAAIAFLAGFSERLAGDVIDPAKLPGASARAEAAPGR
jgi:hypothetical protein